MKRTILIILVVVLAVSSALMTSAHRRPPCPWRNKHCHPTVTATMIIQPTTPAYTPTPAIVHPDYGTQAPPVVCLGAHCPVKTKAAR